MCLCLVLFLFWKCPVCGQTFGSSELNRFAQVYCKGPDHEQRMDFVEAKWL